MLYDTDMQNMINAITPSTAKLKSKGVDSVKQHITTINRHSNISIDDFKDYVRTHLCNGEITLNSADVAQIEQITQSYLTPEFIYGNNPRCNLVKSRRIDSVGEIEVSLELNHNIIQEVNIAGDFFLIGNIDEGLIAKLKGCNFTAADVARALAGVNVSEIIHNLSNEDFINLIFQ